MIIIKKVVNAHLRTCKCTCSLNNEYGLGKIVDLSIIENDDYNQSKYDEKISTTKYPEEIYLKKQKISTPKIYESVNHQKPDSYDNSEKNNKFNSCQQSFQKSCIIAHNKLRGLHHALPLKSNEELQLTASNFAHYLAERDVFKHSGTRGLGENLAYVWSAEVNRLDDCSGKSKSKNTFI